ncbi:hypothetical protein BW723_12715 [Polaribacter reichenbachii]|uniref:Uncharacterized protein n=1 Tax=Polaribacter reichenbachii TaxID=996801 RepID=A0A1B8U050_9FLAO|nr:hypothetical protein [Polaribacter reichenbachii]APZ47091.1 hypothetical protein BW723_12715 [Polaribacter reichenbachii]AUC17732.1 hypothetical protein BTO17_03165 [Polaribacter reichenbachii]OBY65245.1 hypothetical protein LPB301_09060 [Polaribacter reichenbachii]
MIKKSILPLVMVSLFIISCSNNNKFKIEKGKVGLVDQTTTVKDLKVIFKNDSIVTNLSEGALGDNYFQDDDEYLIYEKGGKHLLTIIPQEQLDSTSTIKSIEIHDARFKTNEGINLNSNFSEINSTNILRPESTLQSVTLFVDELNVTIAIDKQELGLRDFSTQKVSLEQIPDLAKMKSFVVWFN